MAIIELEGLSKSYRVYQKQEGLLASVRGLFRRQVSQRPGGARHRSDRSKQGEFVAFLGPNGAGKTTTLKLLSGVITPTGGTARVHGARPLETRERLPPPLCPGDGAKEPTLVGPAGCKNRSACTNRSTASSRTASTAPATSWSTCWT